MGLLDRIMSFLGGGEDERSREPPSDRGTNVTVEREAAPENEAAVKGVGGSAAADAPAEADTAPGTDPDAEGTDGAAVTDEADETDDGMTEGAAPAIEEAESEPESEPEPEPEPEPDADAEAVESDPVDSISGIGPTYAGRLEEAGIATVADLAAADPATVADAAQASESRASDWIDQATDR